MTITKTVFFGALFQLCSVAIILLLSKNLNITLHFFDCCWAFSAISIITLLPITIGGLGLREGAFIGVLGLIGVAHEDALVLSLILFSFLIVTAVVGGVINFSIYKKV